MPRLNLTRGATDNAGVDQVSRPMQIALVAVVLLAGMWFTVLRPKPETAPAVPAVQEQPVAPGTKGLAGAVDKAQGAAAASDAANSRVQAATGATNTTAAAPSKAPVMKASATKAPATPAAAAKPATTATTATDPSQVLLDFLAKGKTVVLLFHSGGADDAAARKAVHRVALKDKQVVTAYADISRVGAYSAITSGVQVLTAPTTLVIGTDRKAIALTGYVDAATIEQTVGDVRRNAAKAK